MRIKETADDILRLQMMRGTESRLLWPVWSALVVALLGGLVAWGVLRFLSPPAKMESDAVARVMVVLGEAPQRHPKDPLLPRPSRIPTPSPPLPVEQGAVATRQRCCGWWGR